MCVSLSSREVGPGIQFQVPRIQALNEYAVWYLKPLPSTYTLLGYSLALFNISTLYVNC